MQGLSEHWAEESRSCCKALRLGIVSANAINRLADIGFTGGVFTNTVPVQSITLFVLPFGTPPPAPSLQSGSLSSTNTFDLWLSGTARQRYVQTS